MRKKRTWRYYCDYCKKAGCSAGHMATHEKHCCGNPQRVCRMCRMDLSGDVAQQPMADLTAAYAKDGVAGLRTAANGCPACMLAALIIWRKGENIDRNDPENWEGDFDFKKERDRWFAENAEREDAW